MQWAGAVRLLNTYGVTEATVYQTAVQMHAGTSTRLIGWPFVTVRLRIANGFGFDMPPGSVGELWVGGPQVATGYTRTDAQGAFVAGPGPGPGPVRWYRTGDLAHLGAAGVVLHGRTDFQVKVRGQRVELDEIACVAQECPFVARAVAVLFGDRLVVYVVVTQGCAEVEGGVEGACDGACAACVAVRLHCARILPRHMVPHAAVAVASFAMTVNNKIDRAALPEPPAPHTPGAAAGLALAQGDVLTGPQQVVARGWAAVLGVPVSLIGPHAHFERLGGDSLAALRTVRSIRIAIVGEDNVLDPEDHRGIHTYPWGVADFLARPVLSHYTAFLVAAGALPAEAKAETGADTGATQAPGLEEDGDEGVRAVHDAAREGHVDVVWMAVC
jgi:hypothetical protein